MCTSLLSPPLCISRPHNPPCPFLCLCISCLYHNIRFCIIVGLRHRVSFAEAAHGISHPLVFVAPASQRAGRIVIELFDADSPKACENFRALCVGDRGISKVSGKQLAYKGCAMHRIVPGFMAQGGGNFFFSTHLLYHPLVDRFSDSLAFLSVRCVHIL